MRKKAIENSPTILKFPPDYDEILKKKNLHYKIKYTALAIATLALLSIVPITCFNRSKEIIEKQKQENLHEASS